MGRSNGKNAHRAIKRKELSPKRLQISLRNCPKPLARRSEGDHDHQMCTAPSRVDADAKADVPRPAGVLAFLWPMTPQWMPVFHFLMLSASYVKFPKAATCSCSFVVRGAGHVIRGTVPQSLMSVNVNLSRAVPPTHNVRAIDGKLLTKQRGGNLSCSGVMAVLG